LIIIFFKSLFQSVIVLLCHRYWSHRLGGLDGFYTVGQVLETQVDAIATAGYKTVISFREDGEATIRLPSDPPVGFIDNAEFSDENGNWNASLEKDLFEATGAIQWMHAPVNSYTSEVFYEYQPMLASAAALGPVLVHCKSGYRAAVYTLTYLGQIHGHCTTWAIARAKEVGFDLNPIEDSDAINLFKEILGC
jgi:protein tyrosine phosphatase (PTP) superfamily phosphohydrolase (DUF442 family)